MNRLMPIVALIALAAPASAIEVTTTPGQLSGLLADRSVTELTVTGAMDARDFHFIATELTALTALDLAGVEIVAYSDAQRPLTAAVYDYEAGTLPQSMLMGMRLERLTLPASLRAIGMAALAGCDRLTELQIPATVTVIGDYALSGSGLQAVNIPATVTTVGKGAFAHCFDMETAVVNATHVGDCAFLGNEKLHSVQLGDRVRRIGAEAFHGTGLTALDASAATALDSVGGWFAATTPISGLSLPEGLTTLGEGAFFGTTELAAAALPTTLRAIPDYAFAGGSRIVADTLLTGEVETIGDYAFYNWDATHYFFIPSTVARIGTRAMAGMVGLEQIDVAAAVVPALGDSVWAGVDQPAVKLGTPDNNTAELYAAAEQWQDFYILHDYLLGDVNGDGVVDVTDVNLMVNYILGIGVDPFIFKAADIDGNQVIDISDVNGVVNIVLGQLGNPVVRRAMGGTQPVHAPTADCLTLDALSVRPGETYTLDIRLENSRNYSAMQFDIALPSGLEMLDGVSGTSRSARHTQVMRTFGSLSRVMSFSFGGSCYADTDDAIVRLRVKATGEVAPGATIDITHVVLASPDGEGFIAADTSAPVDNTTGIENLTADAGRVFAAGSTLVVEATEATTVQVVSLNGTVRSIDVPAGHSEWTGLAAGVYVVRLQGKSYKVVLD